MGVYTQPVDSTLADLAPVGVAMERVRADRWQGARRGWWAPRAPPTRRARSSGSTPSGWCSCGCSCRPGRPRRGSRRARPARAPMQDIRFDAYVPLGASWLASRVTMYVGARRVLYEEYARCTADPALPAATFDVTRWREAPHWTQAAAGTAGATATAARDACRP
jgi:hypothetical protein